MHSLLTIAKGVNKKTENYCPLIKNICRDDCIFRFGEAYCLITSMALDTGIIATALDNKYKQPHFQIIDDNKKKKH